MPDANGSAKAPVGSTTKVRHIRLGAAGVGIRGTDFEAEVAADGSGSIHLHSGELEISSVSGGAPFRMTAGQVVTFTSAGIFSSPEPSKKPTS